MIDLELDERSLAYRIAAIKNQLEFAIRREMQAGRVGVIKNLDLGYVERQVWRNLFRSGIYHFYETTNHKRVVNQRIIVDLRENMKFSRLTGFPRLKSSGWEIKEYTNHFGEKIRCELTELVLSWSVASHKLTCNFKYYSVKFNETQNKWIIV